MYSQDLVDRAIEDYSESQAPTQWRKCGTFTKLCIVTRIAYCFLFWTLVTILFAACMGSISSLILALNGYGYLFIRPFMGASLIALYVISYCPKMLADSLEGILNPARLIHRRKVEATLRADPNFQHRLVAAFLAKQALQIDLMETLPLEPHPPAKP